MGNLTLVRIPLELRTNETSYAGIPVREAFYTAYCRECQGNKLLYALLDLFTLEPITHPSTYVIDGRRWNIDSDVMIRTEYLPGKIEPKIMGITDRREEDNIAIFVPKNLTEAEINRIDSELGLLSDYRECLDLNCRGKLPVTRIKNRHVPPLIPRGFP